MVVKILQFVKTLQCIKSCLSVQFTILSHLMIIQINFSNLFIDQNYQSCWSLVNARQSVRLEHNGFLLLLFLCNKQVLQALLLLLHGRHHLLRLVQLCSEPCHVSLIKYYKLRDILLRERLSFPEQV